MFQDKYVFAQLTAFLNRTQFNNYVRKFDGNEAHRAKQYHLGLGREPIAKTTLASANQNRDYRIFEDFAFYMMKEACEKRATNILDIPGKKYAFDSTTQFPVSQMLTTYSTGLMTHLWNSTGNTLQSLSS